MNKRIATMIVGGVLATGAAYAGASILGIADADAAPAKSYAQMFVDDLQRDGVPVSDPSGMVAVGRAVCHAIGNGTSNDVATAALVTGGISRTYAQWIVVDAGADLCEFDGTD